MSTPAAEVPLLQLEQVAKIYAGGDGAEVRALDGITLSIAAGEFVAIMGQSGSGKSTLMNVLGCLDTPTRGRYQVRGIDVATLGKDELASLRRDCFGFVFQRYNLMTTITAAENVELPAIYAGAAKAQRVQRAAALLGQLGLGERLGHKPNQLSGGQQQRVSIARALMNGADVILADEPTGALDSKSGEEVLALLGRLHGDGHTIILITHDAKVAAHAERIIQISDGRITEDSGSRGRSAALRALHTDRRHPHWLPDLGEAVKMALHSLRGNLFRSALTLLGVVIGVAAVVTMLAIGNGSKAQVMKSIESMGSNLLLVQPGAPGTRPSGEMAMLKETDAEAIEALAGVQAVSPQRQSRQTLRYGNIDYKSNVTGVWPTWTQMQDWKLSEGVFVSDDDVKTYAPVIVLGTTVARNLFPDLASPIGLYVLVGKVPFQVVGVLASKGANAFGSDMDDVAVIPLSTGFARVFGKRFLGTINVKLASADVADDTEAAITELLTGRHGTIDFQVRSTTSLMEMATTTQNTLTLLLGSVAFISLLVGGIGVMNIMLVNVTERTREIGVRMATGARTSNILLQFNTEALVICGIGGVIGVLLGIGAALAAEALGSKVVFTVAPALFAFGSAFITGLLFGYLPARKAANLDPVVALASE
ncbi:MacB family efflux pump subunit [Nevskia ramosa]|uniref:MacB family efflux pump subunit n=1 Tax=Nevskia ramosa TaxID=64002 RepID=UPI003D0CBF57